MSTTFLAAAVQMSSGVDKARNLADAQRLVRQAAAAGAELIVLPELFNCLGRPDVMLAAAEDIPGPTSQMLSDLARELGVVLVGGSFGERRADASRAFNTSLIFDRSGRQIARYRKLHLFDVDLAGHPPLRESGWLVPGEEIVVTDVGLARVGQTICYDLRFGALFGRLADAGAEVIVVPAAFTAVTGRDHWEILLRARAIENQAFVVAANQVGVGSKGVSATYGHSLIVDPWGTVLARADCEEPTFIMANLERARLDEIRARLPALQHRRTFLS